MMLNKHEQVGIETALHLENSIKKFSAEVIA